MIYKNKCMSLIWIVLIMLILGFVLSAFNYIMFDSYVISIFISGMITVVMSLYSYFNCDKMVLKSSGAIKPTLDEDFRLRTILERLTLNASLPMPKYYVIPDSALNAFATGRNPKNAVVCVTRGLLNNMNDDELSGVLAHELSHVKNYDILLGTVVAIFGGIIFYAADIMLRGSLRYGSRRSKDRDNGAITSILLLIVMILSFILVPLIKLAISRQREYMADARGAEIAGTPLGLISALKKLDRDNKELDNLNSGMAHLYISNPKKKSFNLMSTHPSISDRVERLEKLL